VRQIRSFLRAHRPATTLVPIASALRRADEVVE
jgi:hypothetical protein